MFIDDRGRLPIWRWWAACSDRKLVVWRVYVEAQRPGRLSVGLPSGDAYTVLRRQGTTRAPAGVCEIVSATNGAVIWRAGGRWPCCWGQGRAVDSGRCRCGCRRACACLWPRHGMAGHAPPWQWHYPGTASALPRNPAPHMHTTAPADRKSVV